MRKLQLALLIAAVTIRTSPGAESPAPVYRNTAPGVHYVGTETCATCHSEIAAHYSGTSMGQSMRSADKIALPADAPLPSTVFDSETREYFEVSRQGDSLVQSQYALDSHGKLRFRQDWKVAYLIGSGENGIGFLIRRDRYLFEAPLSYYSQSKTWSFSPGYERHNYAFTRPVIAECASCHSGRPQPVYGTSGLYQDPPFAELAVGCENCHGPGELHVAERRAAVRLTGRIDTSIVNPAHLSGWLSDNVCMSCHQGGDVRVTQPGKHAADFRPGTQLDSVLAIFKAPLHRTAAASPDVLLEHYFSMKLSKCYRASGGNLHCTSCHDPHIEPRGSQTAGYYRAKCLNCHASQSCKLDKSERQKTKTPDDCVACHMRKRTVAAITHAALTEHRVTVRPEEPLPDSAFTTGTEPSSGLIHLTVSPENGPAPVPDTTLFQACATLVHAGRGEFRPQMDNLLNRLSQTAPEDSIVLSALARRAARQGAVPSLRAAADYMERAIKAGSTDHDNFLLLAEIYTRLNKGAQAIAALQAGIRLNPYSPELPESLADRYIESDDYRNAMDVIRRSLQIFPDDATLRRLSDKIQSAMPGEINGNRLQ